MFAGQALGSVIRSLPSGYQRLLKAAHSLAEPLKFQK